ncbi:MAG: SLC13 family permease [Acidobacteriota bacterium]
MEPLPTSKPHGPPAGQPPHEADRQLPSGRRQRWGLWAGLALFALMLAMEPPAGLGAAGWRTAAVTALMAIWWMSEAIPIPATSLVPLALFPLLGVGGAREVAAPYANPLIFLFMGGFLIALAMERWRLHRRLALLILRAVGTRPRQVIGGFMLASAGLSMWISNTATAMMMMPIGLSVVGLAAGEETDGQRSGDARELGVCVLLAIAYACSLGGVATLVGTPTNAVLAGFMLESYGVEIAFADWMRVGLPIALVGLAVTYLVLTRWAYPPRLEEIPGGRAFLDGSLKALGPTSRAEWTVAAVFGLVACLWIGRRWLTPFLPGLTDSTTAMLGALLLFVLPSGAGDGGRALDWESARRLPWGVLLLFGGGLSLASQIRDSGLAAFIGGRLEHASGLPILALSFLTVLVIVFLTELTSNTATASAFLPILASIAIGLGEDPLTLLVPAAIAASCAFMLPVATPPNAIVYGSGMVTIPQMVRAGVVLNAIFTVLVTLLAWLLLPWALGVEPGALPPWAAAATAPSP